MVSACKFTQICASTYLCKCCAILVHMFAIVYADIIVDSAHLVQMCANVCKFACRFHCGFCKLGANWCTFMQIRMQNSSWILQNGCKFGAIWFIFVQISMQISSWILKTWCKVVHIYANLHADFIVDSSKGVQLCANLHADTTRDSANLMHIDANL